MKKYEIILDEITLEFFEEIAIIVKRPVSELQSDALFMQVEIINRKIAESITTDDE